MKRMIPLLLIVALIFTGCGLGMLNFKKTYGNPKELLAKTISEMFQAIQNKDKEALKKLFSPNVRDNESFDNMVDALFDFIQGDVVSYRMDNCVPSSKLVEYGDIMRDANALFCIETSSSAYYVTIQECLVDSWDKSNEGIRSMYIIDTKNWQTEFLYWGDGLWTEGIHIETGNEPHYKDVLE